MVAVSHDVCTSILAACFLCLTRGGHHAGGHHGGDYPNFTFSKVFGMLESTGHQRCDQTVRSLPPPPPPPLPGPSAAAAARETRNPQPATQAAKLDCMLQYFLARAAAPHTAAGCVTFERLVMQPAPGPAAWEGCAAPLLRLEVRTRGSMDGAAADLHADFANMYLARRRTHPLPRTRCSRCALRPPAERSPHFRPPPPATPQGGGVLGSGCVQEEIMFVQRPECLVGLLLCEVTGGQRGFRVRVLGRA